MYSVAADPRSARPRSRTDTSTWSLRCAAAVSIPLAVKMGPFFTAMAQHGGAARDAGADGLVLFNRFYQPDIDLDTLEVVPRLVLSTSAELRLPLRWIAILHGRVGTSLAATTGVHTGPTRSRCCWPGRTWP